MEFIFLSSVSYWLMNTCVSNLAATFLLPYAYSHLHSVALGIADGKKGYRPKLEIDFSSKSICVSEERIGSGWVVSTCLHLESRPSGNRLH